MKYTAIIMTWWDTSGTVEFSCHDCTEIEAISKAINQWGYIPPKRFQFWKNKIVMHKFI
jgi:hypothetical protein